MLIMALAFWMYASRYVVRVRCLITENEERILAMGGYALYVWGAYGVNVSLIALEIVLLMRRVASETQT